MKTRQLTRSCAAFTFKELIVVVCLTIFVMTVLGLLLPPLSGAKMKDVHANCRNNLKQIGMAFQLWSADNGDLLPMQVSTNAGGALEPALRGEVFRVFQVMSNELNTPKIVVCPADARPIAYSFASTVPSPLPVGASKYAFVGNSNVSYFIGLDSNPTNAAGWLSGDANLTVSGKPAGSGVLTLTNRSPVGWTPARHKGAGNVLLADGSVQWLRVSLWSTNSPATVRMAVP